MSHPVDLAIKDVNRLIEPVLDEMGFELVDTEYLSEHGKWILRIYIDRQGGVTLDDCVHVSREIGDLIDVKDIFQNQYVLEVSSPGLNRPLKKEKDFLKAIGKKVKVKMHTPVLERRNFTGYLKAFQDGMLYVEISNILVSLPLQNVKKANQVFEFRK
jgi:ribosome maturation factor RimP